MDSRKLRYFAAIYEHGGLSHAAENMRVAASVLSHHLTDLEGELAVRLFVRKRRGMMPTAAGERLYVHAKAILKAMSAAEKDIREASREVAGEVSVGMAYSAVKAIGVDLARTILDDYPEVRLSLSENLSGSTLTHLMTSEVDLALIYNAPTDPRLKAQAVLEERMVCVGKPEFIGKTSTAITFNEILELPLILLRQGISSRAIIDDIGLLKKVEAKAKLQMNSVQAIVGSLMAGLGCAIGTELLVQEQLLSGALSVRPIVEPRLSRILYVCELADRPSTYALEAVRDVILSLIAEAVRSRRWEANLVEP